MVASPKYIILWEHTRLKIILIDEMISVSEPVALC